jgi:hypothetical protein
MVLLQLLLEATGDHILLLLPLPNSMSSFHGESNLQQQQQQQQQQQGSDADPSGADDSTYNWYGNIQYLINISAIGAMCCIILFLVVKLRSDRKHHHHHHHHHHHQHHHRGPKLRSVWHATGAQIGAIAGANAPQFLAMEACTFLGFLAISIAALLVLLPINIYGGSEPLHDQFSRSTVIHIATGSPLLWCHYAFMLLAVGTMHLCIRQIAANNQASSPSSPSPSPSASLLRSSSSAVHSRDHPHHDPKTTTTTTTTTTMPDGDRVASFTLMLHRVPRSLSAHQVRVWDVLEDVLEDSKMFQKDSEMF